MKRLWDILHEKERLAIGLMSGTSVDGIDAALIRINDTGGSLKITELAFENYPYPKDVRSKVFRLFEEDSSSSKDICHMNFLLGEIFADAALKIIDKGGYKPNQVHLIGSHGQTIYHIPEAINDCGYNVRSTLQIGEGAVIARRTGIITVDNFRVMDIAAGGLGAPLVPYAEYMLFASPHETVALQNIGGVGNITVIPAGAGKDEVLAFDTGPGNMIMDYLTAKATGGTKSYDENGAIAAKGVCDQQILAMLMEDKYLAKLPPKTTGREYFGKDFSESLWTMCKAKGVSDEDMLATATAFTAETISYSCKKYVPHKIQALVLSGGGSYNHTLRKMIQEAMPDTRICSQEDFGYNSDSKEAVAFAVLANETIKGNPNNVKSATGAEDYVVLGKINL